jgi:hypothetical protein
VTASMMARWSCLRPALELLSVGYGAGRSAASSRICSRLAADSSSGAWPAP